MNYDKIREYLSNHSERYPKIIEWFDNKVLPNLETRKIFVKEIDGEIVALGIAKKEDDECKICHLSVVKEYQNKGYGIKMLNQIIEYIGNRDLEISIDARKLMEFKRVFAHFKFYYSHTKIDLYSENSRELFFKRIVR